VDAVKAYDMLTKSIDEEIAKEEQERQFEKAAAHKKEL
jgi:hypothetical protein